MKGNPMQNKRIIYQNDDGGVAVLTPADCGLTIEQIAAKDVPKASHIKLLTRQTFLQIANGVTVGPLTKRI